MGSHLDTFLMMVDLNTNLTYDIFIHDPSYYLTTLSPSAFPHIRIKRRARQPLDQSRNFDLLYVTETKHKKLNRQEFRLEHSVYFSDMIIVLGVRRSKVITSDPVSREVS